MTGADGLATAVEQAMAATGGEGPAQPALQLPLLPAADIAGLPETADARRTAIQGPRKAGRPAGAPNKRTADWRDFLLSRYPSPLVALAEAYSRPVADLVAELGCTKLEAFGIQIKAAAELAPYLHGKMPVEVSFSGAMPTLMLADPRLMMAGAGAAAFGLDALMPIIENPQDQPLSEGEPVPVGQSELDSAAKAEPDQPVSHGLQQIADLPEGGE